MGFFFSSRRRHTRLQGDWSSDVCSSDLITTSMTLLEFADASQPLLRRLQVEAPGTYSHSLQVATLAEAAAEAIGVNSLRSEERRVGKEGRCRRWRESRTEVRG